MSTETDEFQSFPDKTYYFDHLNVEGSNLSKAGSDKERGKPIRESLMSYKKLIRDIEGKNT